MTNLAKEIIRIEEDMTAAFNREDVKKFLTFFEPDMVGFSSTTHNLIEGLDALKETVEYYLEEGEKVEYSISNINGAGFWGYRCGQFSLGGKYGRWRPDS